MLKPIANHEFCTMGNGYKIHVRSLGSNKAKCGSNGRRTLASKVSIVNANKSINDNGWELCTACAKHTTND